MLTCGDVFSGGGGFSMGVRAAGFTPIWAVEHDPAVAEVYAANLGNHVIVQSAQDVDIRKLEAPDLILCSPPCQSHSNARSKKLALRDDHDIGLCLIDYIRILHPRFVMIENVEGWKRSKAFAAIFEALHTFGYWTNVQVLNAADFGVPQTRRRLILRASREGWLPVLPPPTPWAGWYGAIEDLIDDLPESRFADWQLKRLPEYLTGPSDFLLAGARSPHGDNLIARDASDPATTVVAGSDRALSRAFIVRSSDQRENCDIARNGERPVFTLTEGNTSHGRVKAFVVDCQNNGAVRDNGLRGLTIRESEAPFFSVQASQSHMPARAFIVGGGNTNLDKCESKAREASEPTFTVAGNAGWNTRAWLEQGRVVAMTPRALARFQSIPDDYQLPDKTGLACKIIGNMVPPLLAQRLCEGFK